jgi:hypothetical protein
MILVSLLIHCLLSKCIAASVAESICALQPSLLQEVLNIGEPTPVLSLLLVIDKSQQVGAHISINSSLFKESWELL